MHEAIALDQVVATFASDIDAFLDGGAEFPSASTSIAFAILKDSPQWDLRLKVLLPIADALKKWEARRLPTTGAPSSRLLRPQHDVIMILSIVELSRNFTAEGRPQQLLDDAAWSRDERRRLLARLSALPDYVLHRQGMKAHSFAPADLPNLDIEYGENLIQGATTLLLSILGGMHVARRLALDLRAGAPAASNLEVEAAVRAAVDPQQAVAAANEILKTALLPEVLSSANLAKIEMLATRHWHLVLRPQNPVRPDAEMVRVMRGFYAQLLVITAQKLQKAEMQEVSALDTHFFWRSASHSLLKHAWQSRVGGGRVGHIGGCSTHCRRVGRGRKPWTEQMGALLRVCGPE